MPVMIKEVPAPGPGEALIKVAACGVKVKAPPEAVKHLSAGRSFSDSLPGQAAILQGYFGVCGDQG